MYLVNLYVLLSTRRSLKHHLPWRYERMGKHCPFITWGQAMEFTGTILHVSDVNPRIEPSTSGSQSITTVLSGKVYLVYLIKLEMFLLPSAENLPCHYYILRHHNHYPNSSYCRSSDSSAVVVIVKVRFGFWRLYQT